MHAFHSDPVVVNKFPSRLQSHGFACFLPFAYVKNPDVFEVVEAVDFPMRAVLDRLCVGFHLDLENTSSGGKVHIIVELRE